MRRLGRAGRSCLCDVAVKGSALAAADVQPVISRGEAAAIFAGAVTWDCLVSRDSGVGIAGLTGDQRAVLRPATGKERFVYKDPNTPV